MFGHQLGLLFGTIAFIIGAFVPAFGESFKFNTRDINWISLGLAFVTCTFYIGSWRP